MGLRAVPKLRAKAEIDMDKLKKPLIWTLVVFCIYALIRQPDQSADMVKGAMAGVGDGLKSIGNFLDALIIQD